MPRVREWRILSLHATPKTQCSYPNPSGTRTAVLTASTSRTVFFQGGYAQVLFFLTGEYQQYQKTEGVFTRVVPHDSLRFSRGSGECGRGAWQAGVRVSYLDLIDQAIDGGQIVDLTFGLNWFLNPNMKIQGNYLVAQRDGQQGAGDGWFSGLGVRAAFDF